MKRKHMISDLAEFLYSQPIHMGHWPLADKVLTFLEEKGMLPPGNIWEPEEYEGSKYDPEGEWGE